MTLIKRRRPRTALLFLSIFSILAIKAEISRDFEVSAPDWHKIAYSTVGNLVIRIAPSQSAPKLAHGVYGYNFYDKEWYISALPHGFETMYFEKGPVADNHDEWFMIEALGPCKSPAWVNSKYCILRDINRWSSEYTRNLSMYFPDDGNCEEGSLVLYMDMSRDGFEIHIGRIKNGMIISPYITSVRFGNDISPDLLKEITDADGSTNLYLGLRIGDELEINNLSDVIAKNKDAINIIFKHARLNEEGPLVFVPEYYEEYNQWVATCFHVTKQSNRLNAQSSITASNDDNFRTPDLCFFNVHGRVKSVDGHNFTSDGKWIPPRWTARELKDYAEFSQFSGKTSRKIPPKVQYDKQNRISTINYFEGGPCKTQYTWENDRVASFIISAYEGEAECKLIYDPDGLLRCKVYEAGGEGEIFKETTEYSNYIFDSNGNWISRDFSIRSYNMSDFDDGFVNTDRRSGSERRKISYY